MPDAVSSSPSSAHDRWLEEEERTSRAHEPLATLPTRDAERSHHAIDTTDLAPLADLSAASAQPDWRAIPHDGGAYPEGALGDELLLRNVGALERARARPENRDARPEIDSRLAALNGAVDARRWAADAPARQARLMEEARVDDRLAPLHFYVPPGIRALDHVGAFATPFVDAADVATQIAPFVSELRTFLEVTIGRSCFGLGDPIEAGERALQAGIGLAPFAGSLLVKSAAAAARLTLLARNTGRTVEEIEVALRAAQQIAGDQRLLREGLAARGAGAAINAEQAAAMARGQEALYAREVQPWLDARLEPARPPPGYLVIQKGTRVELHRMFAHDALCPPLHVDAEGIVRVGSSERVTDPGALAKALGPRPAEHEAHHVIPDEVLRDSPLFQEARRRGIYDGDAASNGAWLPTSDPVRTDATRSLPLHRGSHPMYNAIAKELAAEAESQVIEDFSSMVAAPDPVLREACENVERGMQRALASWTSGKGSRVR